MSRILILANHYNTLRIFRRELLKELTSSGNDVTVLMPPCDDANHKLIESYGCTVISVPMDRRGLNPLKDCALLRRYWHIIGAIKPDLVLTYTIKCNIYGSLACQLLKVPHYANVTGLGSVFQKSDLLKKMAAFFYKAALAKAEKVFFENVGNRDTFVKAGIIPKRRSVVMPGAGVNTEEFKFCAYPANGDIRFLFVGRIMKEKGIDELFCAIEKIKRSHENVIFDFIGWYEDDYKDKVAALELNNSINYLGFQENVQSFIVRSHCVILPSHHEGMSNSLLEAGSMGRPLIASDIHGCREALVDGVSGFLNKVGDAGSLCEKIIEFINLGYPEKVRMGKESCDHVSSNFDKRTVVAQTIRELNL